MGTRLPAAAAGLLAAAFLSGCGGDPCEPSPHGTAAEKVTVTRGSEALAITAEILDWTVEPHPQVPDRGDQVNFRYRFTPVGGDPSVPLNVELQACAVDAERVVLICTSVAAHPDDEGTLEGDGWLAPDDASRTERVLLLPDQMTGGTHPCTDDKDADGYHPPALLGPGDRL